jgi:hypothetical protein
MTNGTVVDSRDEKFSCSEFIAEGKNRQLCFDDYFQAFTEDVIGMASENFGHNRG